jgi:hypothetical protein
MIQVMLKGKKNKKVQLLDPILICITGVYNLAKGVNVDTISVKYPEVG